MTSNTISGSPELAQQIRDRRKELGFTIEEAADRAGVGTKTWSRYEAGASISKEKYKGICRALNWANLPGMKERNVEMIESSNLREHEAWSIDLENRFGAGAAWAFAEGSDLLLDQIKMDLSELASMPRDSHVGQIGYSYLESELPQQFLTRYDYDFLYRMKFELERLRKMAHAGVHIIAHSVLQELIFFLCDQQIQVYLDDPGLMDDLEEEEGESYYEGWVYDLFGDMDIVTWLYSELYVPEGCEYHFDHWTEDVFYIHESASPNAEAQEEKEERAAAETGDDELPF